jgi:hypothetical protein
MGWRGRQDLESDVPIYFNTLPAPWFQTQKQPTKIPVRIVAGLILKRFELRISKHTPPGLYTPHLGGGPWTTAKYLMKIAGTPNPSIHGVRRNIFSIVLTVYG